MRASSVNHRFKKKVPCVFFASELIMKASQPPTCVSEKKDMKQPADASFNTKNFLYLPCTYIL